MNNNIKWYCFFYLLSKKKKQIRFSVITEGKIIIGSLSNNIGSLTIFLIYSVILRNGKTNYIVFDILKLDQESALDMYLQN